MGEMWVRVTGLQPEDLGNIHIRLKLGVPFYTITTLLSRLGLKPV